ncbi:MAG: PhnD/SsuA/transferrin family substrate-binding protein [Desulfobulbaceae bacterium]|nr:PhnD/SsuA/transferrin family substrate-binding protein [Desulfobulbaceae bacterium]
MKKNLAVSITAVMLCAMMLTSALAAEMSCWFPPEWRKNPAKVQAITQALSEKSGITIKPRIAKSYPEILTAFACTDQNLVYVGSFVQAIIKAKDLGTALVQNIDGEDLYSGVLVYPKGSDPEAILKNSPAEISYAKGASSGETAAKAATGGKASIAVPNHDASCAAVLAGKAKAGVVKNWWWEKNKGKYATLDMYRIPGISIEKNPDNVLTASKAIPADLQAKITEAAIASKDAFGAPEMVPFDQSRLDFPLEMMAKGGIDPKNYAF